MSLALATLAFIGIIIRRHASLFICTNPSGNLCCPFFPDDLGFADGVTYIDDNAFSYCDNIRSVTIPESVKYIGYHAFYGCSGLTSVTIPSSVASIGEGAFLGCSALTSVRIPSSVTRISDFAFQYCSSLTSVRIPSSVTRIGNYAFSGCSGLTSVTIPSSVTSLGEGVFQYCSALTSLTIPSSVTSIGSGAFSSCSGLTSVTIPSSVTTIESFTFLSCSGLTSVTIPASVVTLFPYSFESCTVLSSVKIHNNDIFIHPLSFQGTRFNGLSAPTCPYFSKSTAFTYTDATSKSPQCVPQPTSKPTFKPLIIDVKIGPKSSRRLYIDSTVSNMLFDMTPLIMYSFSVASSNINSHWMSLVMSEQVLSDFTNITFVNEYVTAVSIFAVIVLVFFTLYWKYGRQYDSEMRKSLLQEEKEYVHEASITNTTSNNDDMYSLIDLINVSPVKV